MEFNNLIEINKGFFNLMRSKMSLLPEELEQLAEKRKQVCLSCKYFNKEYNACNKCNCYLPAKQKNEDSTCPKEYW